MLLILIALSLLSEINTSPTRDDLQNVMRHLQTHDEFKKIKSEVSNDVLRALNDRISATGKDNSSGCECHGYNCGCCVHLEWKTIKLDDTVCANFSYLPAEYGISVTLTVDKKTIINETVSAKNPPPICVEVPYLKEYASLCIRFRDLSISNKTFSGCVYIEAELVKIKVEEIKVGCFKLPPGEEPFAAAVDTYLHQVDRAKADGAKRLGYGNDSSKLYFQSLKKSLNRQT